METWKDVIRHEGEYEVSDLGAVRHKDRSWGDDYPCLLVQQDIQGYQHVTLLRPVRKMASVHRLVLEAFIGSPEEGHQCNHKNGDRSDNHLENLEWCTREENILHSLHLGHRYAKLNEVAVRVIRWLCNHGRTQKELAHAYLVSPLTIRRIISRKAWGHVV